MLPYDCSQSLYKLTNPQSELKKLVSRNMEADEEWEEEKNLMKVRWIALFPASFSVSIRFLLQYLSHQRVYRLGFWYEFWGQWWAELHKRGYVERLECIWSWWQRTKSARLSSTQLPGDRYVRWCFWKRLCLAPLCISLNVEFRLHCIFLCHF